MPREIFAMIASALEICVLRSEYAGELINFICVAVLDPFLANSEDPNIKNFTGEHAPDPPKRFDQDLFFAPLFWLLQSLVLVPFWLSGIFLPQFCSNGADSLCSFQYPTFSQI